MAKRGRRAQKPYVTMWHEVIVGLRKVVKETDPKGDATVWHLYPTGQSKPYFGTVRHGDVASERRAIRKFIDWRGQRDGLPWDQQVGNKPMVDAIWAGMLFAKTAAVRDRRVEKLIKSYVVEYREFIRNLLLTDCRKAAQELAIEQLAWLDQVKPPAPSLILTEVGEMYFERRKELSEEWRQKSKRMWDEFVDCVEARTVRDITPDSIAKYHDMIYDAFHAGKAPTYAAHRFGTVKAVLAHALKRGKDQEQLQRVLTLCKMLVPPEKTSTNPQPISREHFQQLLKVSGPKWKAVFLLALNACMYPSEVAAIKKQDLNLKAGTLNMERGKTGVPRIAVLWKRTLKAIRQYQALHPHDSEFLVICSYGTPYTSKVMSRNFRERRDKAGLPDTVQFAHIRDGAYTAAIEGGADPLHAHLLAGHRTGIKDHYVRRSPKMVAACCAAIEKHYFGSAVSPIGNVHRPSV